MQDFVAQDCRRWYNASLLPQLLVDCIGYVGAKARGICFTEKDKENVTSLPTLEDQGRISQSEVGIVCSKYLG